MHVTRVKMKDGSALSGYIWKWRPKEGWFSLVAGEEGPQAIQLKDVDSAVEEGMRVGIDRVEDVDLIQRALREGWVP